ncbi:MAG: hypothetical protein ACRD33_11145 [Candidatus Acidiferrales bacterium]
MSLSGDSFSWDFSCFEDPFLEQLERISKIYRHLSTVSERSATRTEEPIPYDDWDPFAPCEEEEDRKEVEKLQSQFALVFLTRAIRGLSDEIKSELCLKTKSKRGGFLESLCTALGELHIDVTARPEWAYVNDVVNARNKVIHPEAKLTLRYLNGLGEAQVNSRDFDELLGKLRQFRDWLRNQVTMRRVEERDERAD